MNISDAGEKYFSHMERYPVITISLKSMKQSTWEKSSAQFKDIIANEFERHYDILNTDVLNARKKNRIQSIIDDTADDMVYSTSLKLLSDCLYEVNNKKVIVLIDEYDVPPENSYFNGFYDRMIDLIRSVFESVLKTNNSLEFGILTGCLRISSDVKALTEYYGIADKFDEIKNWYDGYHFGLTEIYNPWSVLNFIQSTLSIPNSYPEPYWSNTSSNSIIHELISKSDRRMRDEIETLITGGSVDKPLYDDITYINMDVKSGYIWSFLLHTGYLKPIKTYLNGLRNYFTAVIPNLEIVTIYENTFRQWFDESIRNADKSVLLKAFLKVMPKHFRWK